MQSSASNEVRVVGAISSSSKEDRDAMFRHALALGSEGLIAADCGHSGVSHALRVDGRETMPFPSRLRAIGKGRRTLTVHTVGIELRRWSRRCCEDAASPQSC